MSLHALKNRSEQTHGPKVRFRDHEWWDRPHARWYDVVPPFPPSHLPRYLSSPTRAYRAFCFYVILSVALLDITYASLAKAFNQPLVHHAETLQRMAEWTKHWPWVHTQNEEQKCARERMALLPANAETLFVARDIWVVSKPFPPPPRRAIEKWISFD
jgi:hypothetical protein